MDSGNSEAESSADSQPESSNSSRASAKVVETDYPLVGVHRTIAALDRLIPGSHEVVMDLVGRVVSSRAAVVGCSEFVASLRRGIAGRC